MKKLFFVIALSLYSLTGFTQTNAQQIIAATEAVDATLPQINILIKQGEKGQAKALIGQALKQIVQIEADRKRLEQSGQMSDENLPSLAQLQETKRYLQNKANQLRFCVYIICEAQLFGEEFPSFCEETSSLLSENSFSFEEDEYDAEWIITVKAKTRTHKLQETGGMTTYYSFADANITIKKATTGKRICQKSVSEKGGSMHSYAQAGQQAYQLLAPVVSRTIMEQIEQ